MKRIDKLVGNLDKLGFNFTTYEQLKQNNVNKKYINTLWINIIKMIPLSSELLLKLKSGESFKTNIIYDESTYKINYHPVYEEKNNYKLLCIIKSNKQQQIGFNIKLHNMSIVEMDIGQLSDIKQGCYYSYRKRKLLFSYFNEKGFNIYTTEFAFDYHKYDFILNNSQLVYSFHKDKLISFSNNEKEISITFYTFKNTNTYKISQIRKGNITIGFFYKGNVKNIVRVVDDRKIFITYYGTGNIKCKYCYKVDSGLLDGMYIQYNNKGEIINKTNYKEGSLHGICKKFKNGILIEKITYKDNLKEGPYFKRSKEKTIHRLYKNNKIVKRG